MNDKLNMTKDEWIGMFESIHDRKPTIREMSTAHDAEEFFLINDYFTQVPTERIEEYYRPNLFSKIINLILFLLKVIIRSPIALTLLLFNYIKAIICTFVVWFVSKFMYSWLVGIVGSVIIWNGNMESIRETPKWYQSIFVPFGEFLMGKDFMDGNPNFFPHHEADYIFIFVIALIFAILFTKRHFDEI